LPATPSGAATRREASNNRADEGLVEPGPGGAREPDEWDGSEPSALERVEERDAAAEAGSGRPG